MTAVGETVRLRGIARGDAKVLVGRARLSATGWSRPEVLVREVFELELDDGARVRVLTDKLKRNAIVPEHTARGAWDRLCETPFAEALSDQLPGPSLKLELKSVAIVHGDLVEVYGAVTELRFDDNVNGLRDAPTARIDTVRATIIAGGGHPTAAMTEAIAKLVAAAPSAQRAAKKPRGSVISRVSIGLAAIAFATPLVAPFAPRRLDVLLDIAMLGFSFLASALVLYDHEAVRSLGLSRASKVSEESGPATVERVGNGVMALEFSLMVVALHVLGYALFDLVRAIERPTPAVCEAGVTSLATAALLACATALRWFHARSTMRAVNLLLRAPVHPKGLPHRAFGASEGKVSDPTPVRTRAGKAALAMITDTEITPGSDANILRVDVKAEGTFLIETSEGLIEVDPRNGHWGSSVRERSDEPANRERSRNAHTQEIELIPVGGNALVAGRIRRDKQPGAPAQIASTGPESLLIFATDAGTSPRAHLRAFARRHRSAVALLALMSLLLAGMAVSVWHDLPPAPPESDSD